MKVYCSECNYYRTEDLGWESGTGYYCDSPKRPKETVRSLGDHYNRPRTYEAFSEYEPSKINSNNDCPYFEIIPPETIMDKIKSGIGCLVFFLIIVGLCWLCWNFGFTK